MLSTTTIRTSAELEPADRLYLLILSEDQPLSHPLPESGEVVIGRSERCDVRIDSPSISRQHAIVRIGTSVTIEDLGSVNGTMVRDHALNKSQEYEIALNEAITLGSVVVLVQRRAQRLSSRRLWTHDYFEGRVDEECTRDEHTRASFCVLHLRVPPKMQETLVLGAFADVLRKIDVAGLYGPGAYNLMLLDATREEAQVVADRLSTLLAAHPGDTKIGVASYPTDGRTAASLLQHASDVARGENSRRPSGEAIIINDPAMQHLHLLVERVAQGTINVLILGETGVGKQILAEQVHSLSPRANRPFLQLNCSAFSESLLESELFGHERGAFTGAVQAKPGLLETANGGTVFLDEIGDMALTLQVKLLRVLEERKVMRVGSLKPRSIDVRFVSATNRELEDDVMRGTFRQDLFFRINGVILAIPPLRERPTEIEALAQSFSTEICGRAKKRRLTFTAEAMELLKSYTWPGNIRELRNVVERAVLLAPGRHITPNELPVQKMTTTFSTPERSPVGLAQQLRRVTAGTTGATGDIGKGDTDRGDPKEAKRMKILEALLSCGSNQTEAAKILGVSRRTLGKWLETYDLPRPRKKRT